MEKYCENCNEFYCCCNCEKEIRKDTLKVLDVLIAWGKSEQKNNNIYRKSVDELNEDWIDKFEEIKKKWLENAARPIIKKP